jgi:predicted transcriptional regulator
MVEDYLRTHAGEEFSPSAIGKALDRSSGAVNNALEKLVTDGYAVRTKDKPKRFAIKPEN